MAIRIMLFGLIALSAAAAGAGDLYRWVDENGSTHVSDVVPAPYRGIAERVDTSASEISDAQRQEALARAAREKQLADERDRAAQIEQSQPPPTRPKTAELSPSDNSDAECEQLIREYRESQECFAPFMFSHGNGRHRRSGVRQEAYLYCKRVQSPYAKCGLPSRSPSDAYPFP